MANSLNDTSLLALSDFPKILKQLVKIPSGVLDKRPLDDVLVEVLTEFFTAERLCLDHEKVLLELQEIKTNSAEMMLAKLRSLLEKQARRDIGNYCQSLNKIRRSAITAALHKAGIHHFRENLETDLYVGIHTAISANFKMMGVVYSNEAITTPLQADALDQLFRSLSYVAAQPLGVLLALEGIFWDRGLYLLPKELIWIGDCTRGDFFLNRNDLERRLASANITEAPLGCPAMRAKTPLGERVLDFVQKRCRAVVDKYFI
jgi:hypothetical protein